MATKREKTCIASFICGILGLVGGAIPVVGYFTLVLAILAIVFGVKGRKGKGKAPWMATVGLILGILGIAGTVFTIVCAGAICAGTGAALFSM